MNGISKQDVFFCRKETIKTHSGLTSYQSFHQFQILSQTIQTNKTKMSSSINIRFIGIIAILSAIILMLQITSTMTQITFSKDWRAGGKRSFGSNNGYSNNADNLMEIFTRNNHCDQITNNLIIIQELIRVKKNFSSNKF